MDNQTPTSCDGPQAIVLKPTSRELMELSAAELVRRATGGDVEAQFALGLLYCSEDRERALSWYTAAAMAGCAEAQNNLAILLAEGASPAAVPEARRWLERAAASGLASAQYNLGMALLDSDPEQGIRWLQAAADQGLPAAQFALAQEYESGKRVDQDMPRALSLYRQAAERGFGLAQYWLGFLCEAGLAAAEEVAGGCAYWYRRAAETGEAAAQRLLGEAFAFGRWGLAQDMAEARKWLTAAAEQGDPAALFVLAGFLTQETDDRADVGEATDLLQRAVQRASALELFSFGRSLWDGHRGWRPNRVLAWAVWRLADREGLPMAERILSEHAAMLGPEERLAASIVAEAWAASRARWASGTGR